MKKLASILTVSSIFAFSAVPVLADSYYQNNVYCDSPHRGYQQAYHPRYERPRHKRHRQAKVHHHYHHYEQPRVAYSPPPQQYQPQPRYNQYRDYDRGYQSHTPTVVGGIVGGLIGNQFGKGRGKTALTAAGAILGGSIGRDYGHRGY